MAEISTSIYAISGSIAILGTILLIIRWFMRLECDLILYLAFKFGRGIGCLRNKVIWISGASQGGIGEHLAYHLAKAGAKLILSGDQDSMWTVRENCIEKHGRSQEDVLVIPPFDICDIEKHQEAVDMAIRHFGRIDILINNIGRTQRASFTDIETDMDRKIFDINVFGQVNLTRIVLKHFLEHGGGHMVAMSSVAGKIGAPFSASYTASKHALIGYFETIRAEYGSRGISVTIICPGPVKSNLLSRAFHVNMTPITSNEGKMETSQATEYMCAAIANELDEVWIAPLPLLAGIYASQYFPFFFKLIFPEVVTPEVARKFREGKSTG